MPVSQTQHPSTQADQRFMTRALSLARRGAGYVEPNPMVGCVLVRGGKIVGEGYHRRFGGPHAEVDALRRCCCPTNGITLYVTLEPCCHQGKTPPCSAAIIRAGIARVVVATGDPNPLVCGKGIRKLRRAGITVDVGLLRSEAAELIAPFSTLLRLKRPYVIAKWAQSLDGKLATTTGESKWISCPQSRRHVHRLRARVDAILVGSETVRADDPLLTARDVRVRRRALRVVLDSRLRAPEHCQLIDTAMRWPTLIMTTVIKAKSAKADRLRRGGAEVIGCRSNRNRIATKDWMAKLAQRGISNLLVEGGPTVLSSLLESRLVDEAWVFTAPILIGGRSARSLLDGRGVQRMVDAIEAKTVHTQSSGRDTLQRLRLTTPG